MREKVASYVGLLIGTLLLIVSIVVVRGELKSYSLQDVLQSFRAISGGRLAIASGLTALGYGAMTGYDALAFRHLRRPLAYWRIAIATFISTAFSNTIGFALLTGSAIRYRLYSAWGISKISCLASCLPMRFWPLSWPAESSTICCLLLWQLGYCCFARSILKSGGQA